MITDVVCCKDCYYRLCDPEDEQVQCVDGKWHDQDWFCADGKYSALIQTLANFGVKERVCCRDCIYADDFDCPAPLPTGYLCQKGHGSHMGDWFCDEGKRADT